VTLLCLARDAAARLPDAVGTRADILELIQYSQYLKFEQETAEASTTLEQLSVIISGALDRLHYEADQCVRYDSDRKLWIYQHAERRIDSKLWGTGEQTDHTLHENSYRPKDWQGDVSKHREEILHKRSFTEAML